jgi:hypothetical protein
MNRIIRFFTLASVLAIAISQSQVSAQEQRPRRGAFRVPIELTFDFSGTKFERCREEIGHGWEPGASESSRRFSVRVPEGNHRVTVTVGNADASATTTIKAELRRLMIENVPTGAGESKTVTFIVNTRRPGFGDGREVRLKDRERKGEWIA